MVLHATPSPRERETVAIFHFPKKSFQVITAVTSTPSFPCSLYFHPSTQLILNEYTPSISFKYVNSNTKLGCRYATGWWYSRFPKLNPAPVSTKPYMQDDFGPYPIEKFRCGSCWDICTTTFDLLRDSSNTGILSLCRYGIKCSCRYSSFLHPPDYEVGHCFQYIYLSFLFFHSYMAPLFVPHNLSCGFLCQFFQLPHTPPVRTLRQMDQPFHR